MLEALDGVTLEPEDLFGPENWEIISNLSDAGVYELATDRPINAEIQGRTIELNSADEMGCPFTPMELLLAALGGWTGMDFQWIPTRERQHLTGSDISVVGKRRDEDPRYYEAIDLNYTVHGTDIRREAVERAIRLSQEKYSDSIKFTISYSIVNGSEPPRKFIYQNPIPARRFAKGHAPHSLRLVPFASLWTAASTSLRRINA